MKSEGMLAVKIIEIDCQQSPSWYALDMPHNLPIPPLLMLEELLGFHQQKEPKQPLMIRLLGLHWFQLV